MTVNLSMQPEKPATCFMRYAWRINPIILNTRFLKLNRGCPWPGTTPCILLPRSLCRGKNSIVFLSTKKRLPTVFFLLLRRQPVISVASIFPRARTASSRKSRYYIRSGTRQAFTFPSASGPRPRFSRRPRARSFSSPANLSI